MGGGNTKPYPIRQDTFDFELQPFLLGWEYEENVRDDGLKNTDFEFHNTIGISMFGYVCQARHKASGNWVAVKVLRKRNVIKYKQVRAMQLEKEIMMLLNHPFIARCGSAFQDATRLHLVVELGAGGDLYSLIQRQPKKRLDDRNSRFYAACIAMALQYLHNRDLAFRALNPENVIIDAKGYPKLIDFQQVAGLIERPNKGRSEFTGKKLKKKEYWTVGEHPGPELVYKARADNSFSDVYTHNRRRFTPHYFAPEVVALKRHGKSVDWWSLGVLIGEMLCGYPPYMDADPPGLYFKIMSLEVELPVYVTPIARDIIIGLMLKDPDKRVGSKGVEELVSHPWFSGFPWQRCLYGRMPPPWVPDLVGPTDMRYFDVFPQELSSRDQEGDTKAGALFKAYDETGQPPLTLLPPRHCMYGLKPDEQKAHEEEEDEDEEEGEEGEEGEGGGDGEGEDGEEGAEGSTKKSKKKEMKGSGLNAPGSEAEKADEALIDRLCADYGVDRGKAEAALKKHKYNEDKAAEELEKDLSGMEMTEDDLLGATGE